MRKLFFAVATVLFAAANTFAQSAPHFGVKMGFSLSNQRFDYTQFSSDFDDILGNNMALSLEWPATRHFNILAELHFVQKGMTDNVVVTAGNSPEPVGELKFKNRVNYLSVPVLAKVGLRSKSLSPYVIAGPRVDFKLGYESGFFDEIYDDFKSITFGASLGLGTELNLGANFTPLLEVRYSPDFSKSYSTELLTVRNQSFEFLFGVKF